MSRRKAKKEEKKPLMAKDWRERMVKKLESVIKNSKMAQEIEQEIFYEAHDSNVPFGMTKQMVSRSQKIFIQRYRQMFISILNNLNPKSNIQNKTLLKKVKTKKVTFKELAKGDPIVRCPEKWEMFKKQREAEEKVIFGTNVEANTNLYTCRGCGSKKIHTEERQTRSADEGMTTFFTCLSCGKRWRK